MVWRFCNQSICRLKWLGNQRTKTTATDATGTATRQFGTNNTFSEDHVISAKGLS